MINNETKTDDMLFELAQDVIVATPKKSLSRNASPVGPSSAQYISTSTNKKSKVHVKNTKISLVEVSSSKKNKGKPNLFSESENNLQVQDTESPSVKFPLQ